MDPSQVQCASTLSYCRIVELIFAGDPAGKASLQATFCRGLGFLAGRRCREHADECVRMTLDEVTREICRGKLRSPDHLVSLVQTTLQRVLADPKKASIAWMATTKRDQPVCQTMAKPSRVPVSTTVRDLKGREIEVLRRFYLLGQREEQICGDLELTAEQFRRMKAIGKQELLFAACRERMPTAS